jgi:hypothetical protein
VYVHKIFCVHKFRWHPHLQSNLRRTFASHSIGFYHLVVVIAQFSSPYANLLRRPFPFPYVDLKSLFAVPRDKIIFFPHICALTVIQHVYTQVAPLHPTYIRFCAQIKKNGIKFPCHVTRSVIFDLPYIGNVPTRHFSSI